MVGFRPYRGSDRWRVRVSVDRRNFRHSMDEVKRLKALAREYPEEKFSKEADADRRVKQLNKELPRGLWASKSEMAGHLAL